MDVTLKEPANIAASGPSGRSAWQNIYAFASTSTYISVSVIWGQCDAGHATNSRFSCEQNNGLESFL